ncbi:MAG: transcriptional regulator NrdR [Candidatus Coatesbacteria bacterium]
MKCPFCGHQEDKVVDSRESKEGDAIRRRRECLGCRRRFTTYEQIEQAMPLLKKKDGRWEAFSRDKLMGGLRRACEKRPVGQSELDTIAEGIEKECFSRNGREVTSAEIGEMVMAKLHDLDEVAYVRFASVYRQFKDVTQFMEEVQRLLKKNEGRTASAGRTPGAVEKEKGPKAVS